VDVELTGRFLVQFLGPADEVIRTIKCENARITTGGKSTLSDPLTPGQFLNDGQLGLDIARLSREQQEFSQKTFGTREQRGPTGALKHLSKECEEVMADTGDIMEHADVLILALDAQWRSGFTLPQVVEAALQKMEVNRGRKWPEPTDPNAPVEHIRD
jgi:hypothetical protein